MPPAFFMGPPIPGHLGAGAFIYDDVWEEVADRDYAGYGCLGAVEAAGTLTPTPDARLSESRDYGFPDKPAYTDYRSPAAPKFKDDPSLAGRGKTENVYKKSVGKEENDWMDAYRKPAAAGNSSSSSSISASSPYNPAKSSSLAPPRGGIKVVMRGAGSSPSSSSPTSSSASTPSTSSSKPQDNARGDAGDDFGDFDGNQTSQRRYSIDEDQYGERYSDLWR
ncbi:hypothetical protein JCM11251_000866 [Rhodosporidiobolus azoricus]